MKGRRTTSISAQEEVFFILEGTYELTVDGQTSTAGPGTIVFIPHYFKAISDLAAGGGFTGDKVMQINKQFNTEFPHYANSRGTVARRE